MAARRITIYRDTANKWRYRVQANNWKVIETSEESFSAKGYAKRRVEKKYPGVEVVEA